MGVERAVTRWYLHRQLLLKQVSEQAISSVSEAPVEPPEVAKSAVQYEDAQIAVLKFGPCPRPMMG
jgi:hypothetical protein